jgi:hypothetical protein
MHIVCNNKPRVLQCLADMPEKSRADFDYVDDEYSARFVLYRGAWHDTYDTQRIEPGAGRAHPMGWMMRVHPGSPLARFDGISSDSYFSGTLFRFIGTDSVIVARYYS